ncbi:54S ribosomal protein L7, mitochondrial [Exophiala xenobiotica]|nr:54S ribosomal protein L7, mitochondrial [Exophiala xenobiotica]KAK5226302.1 54S ribosomal protein L7, mitochondrial [Exophiala xenobiotica]KAK5250415.1 54S ribosomal protein L7, mitochondrial [Exophiala xenobiotica]KAK5351350.1 54S ribosomal protein L7, mitochondrial [Exophiala xenobiotica]KAK5383719.1 54S ribosomal protein L7, mitochondrial [Exophiala xenobiotica]
MATPTVSSRLARTWRSLNKSTICNRCQQTRRTAATQAAVADQQDLEDMSSISHTGDWDSQARDFDPLKASRGRKRQLPHSRYQFRSPKYDRGPMHPHQPLPPSDPASREFVPGPFSSPRVEQAYHSIIASDFMTMCYQHTPPGFRPLEKGARLRPWIGDSPYFANRPLRGPRGGDVLRLLRKPITFRNIPMVERVTVHSYVKDALRGGSQHLHVAGMVLQAITNHRVQIHRARTNEAAWNVIKGKPCSMTVDLMGEDMYHFLGKLIDVVLPRIKDWNGVRATTGDNSGNLSFGLNPEVVSGFPEIEVNYDAYPGKMIPGLYITIHTTASCDKDARLLLQQLGVPFYGKIVD